MLDFFEALQDPDASFLRYALLAGVLASVSLGIIGAYVVTRRISYLGGAISHCVLSGIGLGISWATPGLTPCMGRSSPPCWPRCSSAWSASMPASAKTRHRRLWAVGMAVGILLFAATPGYTDPMSYSLRRYPPDFAGRLVVGGGPRHPGGWRGPGLLPQVPGRLLRRGVCLAPRPARQGHLPAPALPDGLDRGAALRLVGIVMVVALLTLPAAVAGFFSRRLWQMMLLAR